MSKVTPYTTHVLLNTQHHYNTCFVHIHMSSHAFMCDESNLQSVCQWDLATSNDINSERLNVKGQQCRLHYQSEKRVAIGTRFQDAAAILMLNYAMFLLPFINFAVITITILTINVIFWWFHCQMGRYEKFADIVLSAVSCSCSSLVICSDKDKWKANKNEVLLAKLL